MNRIHIPRNAFHRTLVGLDYRSNTSCNPDLFSRACVKAYETAKPQVLGYQFTQIFEPGVLAEVALLEGVTAEAMANLDYRPTAAMEGLRQQLDCRNDLGVPERITLASMLISISRFDAAEIARPVAVDTNRERFEQAWVDFLISNRRDDGAASPHAFSRMIDATAEGGISSARIVDACTQGIVWYLKRREIHDAQYRWCIEKGRDLIRHESGLGHGTISSWYRGLAMVPAANRNAILTRRYMTYAYDHAAQLATDSENPGAANALKTYYESCIKEFMYVRPDLERAEKSGHELIAMDPHWSPSYAELAAAYERFGEVKKAAEYYELAVAAGPPYVGHHLVSAARANAIIDNTESALSYYQVLHDISPVPNAALCREALDLAVRTRHTLCDYFRDTLKRSQTHEVGE